MRRFKLITSLLFFCSLVYCQNTVVSELNRLHLPEGFKISIFAKGVENARSMCIGDKGTVFVGSRSKGQVYALKDKNKDGVAEQTFLIAKELNMPNGIVFYKGALYVAEVDKIWRYDNIENQLSDPEPPTLISDDFPSDRHHGWKYIDIGPDEKLYIPVGAPCNVCEKKNKRYSTICRINLDGTDLEVFARGVRNSVGFDWHPITKDLWFTDNGRDLMGDNIPNDELNLAASMGLHFGFPYCHQGNLLDPEYGKGKTCDNYVPPILNLGPHVAALGVHFYKGDMFPERYQNGLFIAKHGSWNRSQKIGYEVTFVNFEKDYKTVKSESVFINGWLGENEEVYGRPVAFLELPDGSLLVSDDFSDCIYRITYSDQ